MDYARFVELRSGLWAELERGLGRLRGRRPQIGHDDLEALAFRYRQVLHDHALAGARFPGTGAARRLQRLALDATHALHWDTESRLGGPLAFLSRTFPRAMRRQAPAMGLAALLFATALVLGATLAVAEPGLGTGLLGPERIAGLREGRLWTEALATTVPPSLSSSGIATNNMSVALTAWAGGAAAGLGAVYVVLLNGFLLGAIVAVTWHYAMAGRLLEFVAAHGPLEITLILVTAGSGLWLGRAVVAATDRPRADELRDASRDALIVLLGSLPWFLVLGAVEALVSPAPGIAPSLKVALGLALEAVYLLLAFNPLLEEAG